VGFPIAFYCQKVFAILFRSIDLFFFYLGDYLTSTQTEREDLKLSQMITREAKFKNRERDVLSNQSMDKK